jgi:hypothetical protein
MAGSGQYVDPLYNFRSETSEEAVRAREAFRKIVEELGELMLRLPLHDRSWPYYFASYETALERANDTGVVGLDPRLAQFNSGAMIDRRKSLNDEYEAEAGLLHGNYISLEEMEKALKRKVQLLRSQNDIPSSISVVETDRLIALLVQQVRSGQNQPLQEHISLYEQWRGLAAFTSQIENRFSNYHPVFFARDAGFLFTLMDAKAKLAGQKGTAGTVYHLNMSIMGKYRSSLMEKVYALQTDEDFDQLHSVSEKKKYVIDKLTQVIAEQSANDPQFRLFIEERLAELKSLGVLDHEKILWVDTGAIGSIPLLMQAIVTYAHPDKEQETILVHGDRDFHNVFDPSAMSDTEQHIVQTLEHSQSASYGMDLITPLESQAKSLVYDSENRTLRRNNWQSQLLAYSDQLVLYNAAVAAHRGEIGAAYGPVVGESAGFGDKSVASIDQAHSDIMPMLLTGRWARGWRYFKAAARNWFSSKDTQPELSPSLVGKIGNEAREIEGIDSVEVVAAEPGTFAPPARFERNNGHARIIVNPFLQDVPLDLAEALAHELGHLDKTIEPELRPRHSLNGRPFSKWSLNYWREERWAISYAERTVQTESHRLAASLSQDVAAMNLAPRPKATEVVGQLLGFLHEQGVISKDELATVNHTGEALMGTAA